MISVIMAAHNAADTVERAIDSALTCPDVSEVCVCNDASTDETEAVITRYLDTERVYLDTHAKQRGQSAALNTAASMAEGRYFIQLDADDWLDPMGLSTLLQALIGKPEHIGFAYGATQFHGDRTDLYTPHEYHPDLFSWANDSLYAVLYRREAWDAGLRYHTVAYVDGKPVGPQDWDFILQLIYHMRYTGVALSYIPVLHHVHHEHGTLTEINRTKPDVLTAFKARWSFVKATQL